MKRNEKKVPGFDEIIFENRNREYGAYDLRKRYKSAAGFSLIGTLTLCALILTLLSVFAPKDVKGENNDIITVVLKTDNTFDPNQFVKPEPPKPLNAPETKRYAEPVVVEDTLPPGNTLMSNESAIDSIWNRSVVDTTGPVVVAPDVPEPDENKKVFIKVEEDPIFPGGPAALLKYIADNTKYPSEASDNNIQGRVIVKFAVWSDGSIKRIEILRKVHPLLDEEAARVVSSLPKWKPGKQNGIPVPVWFNVPVTFKMINQ